MTNIYDVINELYNDDEGWNTVLERRYAEQFLRTEAFHGASDDELLEIFTKKQDLKKRDEKKKT